MEMEDKESTESGSPVGNSDVDSPPSSGGAYGSLSAAAAGGGILPTANINMNMSIENNATGIVTNTPAVLADVAVNGGGVVSSGGGVSGESMMGKKKRGRPRKYDADGKLSAAYLRSPTAAEAHAPPQAGFTLSTPPSYEYPSGSKKGRGKHQGSGNWQALASLGELFANTAGGDFTPHVVTVYTGEDVAGKILTFAQKGNRGICVLSANGSVSNVTLRQPGSSGGLLTYEGRFEILTLTGSFMVTDNGGIKSRSGGLSVSLASSDGRVIGGGLAGMLIAATPIQIVVGSFSPNSGSNGGYKTQKKRHHTEPRISPLVHCAPATVTAAIPISQAAPQSNIYTMPGVQSHGEGDNSLSNKDHTNSASTDSADWNSSGPSGDQRPYPDINISVPVEEH